MNTKNRIYSLLENIIQGVKFHGFIKSAIIHFHYLRCKYFAKSIQNNCYNFLGFNIEFYDIQSVRNLLFEIFGFNSYFFVARDDSPIILDIGANIGDSIIYFKWLYPKSKIYAFEPNPIAYKLLKKNIERNKLKSVSAYNKGLSNEKKSISLFTTTSDLLGSSTTNASINRGKRVQKIIIDLDKISNIKEICKLKKIDLIKIDIEGEESRLFEDLQVLFPKTEKVIIEYHLVPDIKDNSFDYIITTLRKYKLMPNISGFYRNSLNQATSFGSLIIAERSKNEG